MSPVADNLLGESRPVLEVTPEDPTLAATDAMDIAERLDLFSRGFERCIRCYACVKACPACYCTTSFVERAKPQWVPRSVGLDENRMFHVGRAMHLSGRCVDCGACERACPLGVRLGLLNKRLEREVRERFGYTAGLSMEATPALATYSEEDKQEFIL